MLCLLVQFPPGLQETHKHEKASGNLDMVGPRLRCWHLRLDSTFFPHFSPTTGEKKAAVLSLKHGATTAVLRLPAAPNFTERSAT